MWTFASFIVSFCWASPPVYYNSKRNYFFGGGMLFVHTSAHTHVRTHRHTHKPLCATSLSLWVNHFRQVSVLSVSINFTFQRTWWHSHTRHRSCRNRPSEITLGLMEENSAGIHIQFLKPISLLSPNLIYNLTDEGGGLGADYWRGSLLFQRRRRSQNVFQGENQKKEGRVLIGNQN